MIFDSKINRSLFNLNKSFAEELLNVIKEKALNLIDEYATLAMLDEVEDIKELYSVGSTSCESDEEFDYLGAVKRKKPSLLEERYQWDYIEMIGKLVLQKGAAYVSRKHHKEEHLLRKIAERYKAGPSDAYKSILLKKKLKKKFDVYRYIGLGVHDYVLVEWVNELKLKLGIKKLDLTTPSSIQKFKTDNDIVSRKFTKLITTSRLQNHEQMVEDAKAFVKKISDLISNGIYKDANVFNSDQFKCNFEMTTERTLSHKGQLPNRLIEDQ